MSRFIDPRPRFVNEGNTIANGVLYFWETGTTTPKKTWSDPGLTTENTNPVELGGDGVVPEIWLQGNYSVALYTEGGIATGSLIWSVDGYEGSTASSQYGDWSNVTTYSVGDFVKASDGLYYQSLQNNNLGQDPTSEAEWWVQIGFITIWNTNKVYLEHDVVLFEGILYSSLQDSNEGNTPDSSPLFWAGYAGTVAASTVTYDNTASGLTAEQVQAAIDELHGDVQKGSYNYAADTGAADAYVVTLTPAITAYTTGAVYRFLADNTNTGASTLNINGVGATAIRKNGTTALAAGDITSGEIITVVYDGTFFQMKHYLESGDSADLTLGSSTTAEDLGSTDRRVGWVPDVISATSSRNIAESDMYHIIHANTVGGSFTLTIPEGLSGEMFQIVQTGGNTLTIALGGSTELVWLQGGSAGLGSRSIADASAVTFIQRSTDSWLLFGNGIS